MQPEQTISLKLEVMPSLGQFYLFNGWKMIVLKAYFHPENRQCDMTQIIKKKDIHWIVLLYI
jgi:hypothetical protein